MSKIDLSYLEDITGGDDEVMAEMIDLFLEETPKHIQNIEEALKEDDWNKIGSEAHKLKPTFLYVGLKEMNLTAQKVEEYARNNSNLDEIRPLTEKMKEGVEEIKTELEKIKNSLSS